MISSKEFILLRRCVIVAFVAIFLWQTIISINKYLAKATTYIVRTLEESEQAFPSLSICQSSFGPLPKVPFGEELEQSHIPFSIRYSHDRPTEVNGWINETSLDDNWNITITVDSMSSILRKCFTYSDKRIHQNGWESVLFVGVLGSDFTELFVFVHPFGESLLTSNTMHGRDFLVVQKPRNKSVVQTVEVSSSKNIAISKSNLPCEDDRKFNLHKCFEDHVQHQDNCILPWRYPDRSEGDLRSMCNDSTTFREMHQFLTGANEHRLYKKTGCYGSCTYFEYSLRSTGQREHNQEPETEMLDLRFYLKHGGIPFREEVFIFDFLDLVGNVGGFMGLFLGASLLSIIDDVTEVMNRMIGRVKEFKTKS